MEPGQPAPLPTILIVGGADTGRAPMAAALLRRLLRLQQREWHVESAGVTGHDDDPPEPEARNAMKTFGLDIEAHCARSVTEELIGAARLLIAIDRGTARVLEVRHPAAADRIVTLGTLAGQQRDIPDPFRMPVGVWVSYAHEINRLLQAGMPRLIAIIEEGSSPAHILAAAADSSAPPASAAPSPATTPATTPAAPPPAQAASNPADDDRAASRSASIARCERLLMVLHDMPGLVNWEQARQQLSEDILATGRHSLRPDDLVQAYSALLSGLLRMQTSPPSSEHIHMLQAAVIRMHQPIDQEAVSSLSASLVQWSSSEA